MGTTDVFEDMMHLLEAVFGGQGKIVLTLVVIGFVRSVSEVPGEKDAEAGCWPDYRLLRCSFVLSTLLVSTSEISGSNTVRHF